MRYIRKSTINYFPTSYVAEETRVQNHLSYTPSDMLKMAEKGLPVSTMMLSDDAVDMGDTSHGFDVPLENQRFHDPAKLWQASQDIKKRFRDAVKAHKTLNDKIE